MGKKLAKVLREKKIINQLENQYIGMFYIFFAQICTVSCYLFNYNCMKQSDRSTDF